MYRVAVDTGGTFTDVVVRADDGAVWADKALTTPGDIFSGVEAALDVTATAMGLTSSELLRNCDLFTYATTHSTNAILVGDTARTAFLTTKGHPDILVLREGGKFGPFDWTQDYPAPYVPRRFTFEVDERINSEGAVVQPLNNEQVRSLLQNLGRLDVEAVAVCLLWSITNPSHELQVGELIRELMPGVPFTLSHKIAPIIREYRRASAASIDASLKPLMMRHFANVRDRLAAHGFRGELLSVTSTGGVMPVADVQERPIYSVSSGPSICPVSARAAASTEEGITDDLVVCDMGGTSFDVSIVRDGLIQFDRETWLGGQFVGHITGLASVAVKSIGYGGGSIAWIDDGGLLRVGPRSAGSDPGPVSYARGGKEPTVTDAAVVLGYIDPKRFLEGRMELDADAARSALSRAVAEPLELELDEAAAAVMAIAVENMVNAINEITVNQGIDPRECTLVGGGGASGLCLAAIMQELECPQALIPAHASVLSAAGGLYSDLVTEVSMSYATATDDFDIAGVNAVLRNLDSQMTEFLERVSHNGSPTEKQFLLEARYRYQNWEIEVPLPFDRFHDDSTVRNLQELFHEVHERTFGVREAGQHVECLYWSGRARAQLPAPGGAPQATSAQAGAPRMEADVYFPNVGRCLTARYDGLELSAMQTVGGPAIIDLPTTTIVVVPGSELIRTERGHFRIRSGQSSEPVAAQLSRSLGHGEDA